MLMYQFNISLWSIPLQLRIGFPESSQDITTNYSRWGHYNPSKSCMFIWCNGWRETLLHEILEGSILNKECHYSRSGDSSDHCLLVMSHSQFTSICRDTAYPYLETMSFLENIFHTNYQGDISIPTKKEQSQIIKEHQINGLACIYTAPTEEHTPESQDSKIIWSNNEFYNIQPPKNKKSTKS